MRTRRPLSRGVPAPLDGDALTNGARWLAVAGGVTGGDGVTLYTHEPNGHISVKRDNQRTRQLVTLADGTPVTRASRLGTFADGGVFCLTVGPTGLVTLYTIGRDDRATVLSRDEFVRRARAGVAYSSQAVFSLTAEEVTE